MRVDEITGNKLLTSVGAEGPYGKHGSYETSAETDAIVNAFESNL
jgi:hypothetical protein